MKTKLGLGVITFFVISAISTAALAYNEPSSGSFGYELYQFLDESVIAGAIGFIVAIGIVAWGIYWILRSNIFATVLCAIAAYGVIQIKTIVISLGINLPL
jgi:hypothetical protein